MRIAVCVKWVPAISRVRLDPETKRLVREGVPSELNAYDVLAVNRAVELKREHGGEVTVLSMGPPDARRGLVRCLAMGADRAIHLNDLTFAGSDTLATARALALALGRDGYDLILFGNNSVDAETGQVGPEVAELLGLPQITSVMKLDVADGVVRAERALEDGVEVVEGSLPLLASVLEGVAPDTSAPRDAVRAAEERDDIRELTAADLSDDLSQFGANGSPTWVAEVRQIESAREGKLIEGSGAAEAAAEAVAFLTARGAFDEDGEAEPKREAAADALRLAGPEVWVVAEAGHAGLRAVTLELIAAAQPVADAISGRVVALVIGGPESRSYAETLGHAGADAVAVACAEGLTAYANAAYASVLEQIVTERKPYAVLVPSTPNGRGLAARVAARLGLGLTGDCIGLSVDEEGRLAQLKPAFGGNIVAPVYSRTLPNMATVRSGIFEALQPNAARSVPVEEIAVTALPSEELTSVEFRAALEDDAAELDKARAVVCVGMGVGGPERIADLDELCALLGADLICTRDVVEAGWMSRQRQVGLTGRSIAPRLYIGVGVRGDFNHVVGIQRAQTVLVVNTDRRAGFFRGHADVGIVEDWQEFIPAFVAQLRSTLH